MKRGRIKMALVLFATLNVAVSLLPEDSLGLPQFPVRFGSEIYEDHVHEEVVRTMDCRACHVNPTGVGMRNRHGRQFSVEKLPMKEPPEEYKDLAHLFF